MSHFISKVIFLHFQNMSISFSYALNLLQNSSVNYVFSVHFETPPNCYRNVQLFTTLKSKFCQVIQNTATTVFFNKQHQTVPLKYAIIGYIHMKRFQPKTMFQFLILMVFSIKSTFPTEIIYCQHDLLNKGGPRGVFRTLPNINKQNFLQK